MPRPHVRLPVSFRIPHFTNSVLHRRRRRRRREGIYKRTPNPVFPPRLNTLQLVRLQKNFATSNLRMYNPLSLYFVECISIPPDYTTIKVVNVLQRIGAYLSRSHFIMYTENKTGRWVRSYFTPWSDQFDLPIVTGVTIKPVKNLGENKNV